VLFLEAMIYAFGRRTLSDAHTEGWWKLLHLGGSGEIKKRIEQIRADTTGPLRVFVMTDSDRCYQEHHTKTIEKVESYCIQNGIPYAVLQKREIENYLPVNVLNHLPRKLKKTYRAFLNLEQKQRDYYDMKNGFKKDAPEDHEDLFEHIPKRTLDDLWNGFGEVWQYFKSKRDLITEDAIRLSCPNDPEEIVRILNEIECLL